jgi:hypothetical protein
MDETSLLRETLKQQSVEKGENRLTQIEQELIGLALGYLKNEERLITLYGEK